MCGRGYWKKGEGGGAGKKQRAFDAPRRANDAMNDVHATLSYLETAVTIREGP